MFEWLRRRSEAHRAGFLDQMKNIIQPMALASALVTTLNDYLERVGRGEVSMPAYKRKEPLVVNIWSDTRNEVFTQLLGNGSDIHMLGDVKQQRKLLEAFFSSPRAHLEFPHHPNGDPFHDTIQAISRAYLYIQEVGKAVGDDRTDPTAPSNSGRSWISDFEEHASTLRGRWNDFHARLSEGDRRTAPPGTVLEFLYEDITKKTKSIAFCAAFGPNPESGFSAFVQMIRESLLKNGDSSTTINKMIDQVKAKMERFRNASNPDEAE
jgi:hypothetical protein